MVTLENIREDFTQLWEVDRDLKTVEVRADSLDEALTDASVQLGIEIKNLDYEVLERGFDGFLGISKKPWAIKVYPNPDAVLALQKEKKLAEEQKAEEQEQTQIVYKDGEFFVRRFGEKIFLKVTLPQGEGHRVSVEDVMLEAQRSDTILLNEKLISDLVKKGSNGNYEDIGVYKHISANDSVLVIDISKDEMEASATVTAPDPSGADVSKDMILRALKTQGVVIDITEDLIDAFVDKPTYNVPTVVFKAPSPVDGNDAHIEYNFETDRSKLRAQEAANGQVNFKELNLVQNVVKDQPLAKKIPAERGKAGKTLFGHYLEAKNGKDIPMPLGQNVEVAADGVTIVASINGQVLLVNDKVSVEPVMQVDAVNIKTGNITFLGTVICKGGVEDGFDIKASGNIEIGGAVGRCKIESEGDVVISQGVMGRDEGMITASGCIWAKFIQNSTVKAGDSIIVSDSIMNSNVSAKKRIVLQGKRAQITGGHLFATEEICAKNIGSAGGGTETILEVGFDPESKLRLQNLVTEQQNYAKELDEIELNISTLENYKKVRKNISKEKEESLEQFTARRDEIIDKNEEISKEISIIQERLHELKSVGKVSASGTVYPGVKIFVRDEKDEVRTEVRSVTFYYEDGFVRRGKYEQPTEQVRGPSGYSSN